MTYTVKPSLSYGLYIIMFMIIIAAMNFMTKNHYDHYDPSLRMFHPSWTSTIIDHDHYDQALACQTIVLQLTMWVFLKIEAPPNHPQKKSLFIHKPTIFWVPNGLRNHPR